VIAAWQARSDASACSTDWRFTTDHARIKGRCVYPVLGGIEFTEYLQAVSKH
jgi:hypothetical protein